MTPLIDDGAGVTHSMAMLQEAWHGEGHDYETGSPHLRHRSLKNAILRHIRQLIAEQFRQSGLCRVLEIGAGHGGFTDHLAACGAEVTVTEMSRPSLDLLEQRLRWNSKVRLLYDPDGTFVRSDDTYYNLILCVSVLHHIPDYLGFLDSLVPRLAPAGAIATFQDPLWYPRRTRVSFYADRAAYYAWRLGQGDLWRGARTRIRRAKGRYDEAEAADMVEYHVVRSGVDEQAIRHLLDARFRSISQWNYWSTQLPFLQVAGEGCGLRSTFSVIARGRLPSDASSVG